MFILAHVYFYVINLHIINRRRFLQRFIYFFVICVNFLTAIKLPNKDTVQTLDDVFSASVNRTVAEVKIIDAGMKINIIESASLTMCLFNFIKSQDSLVFFNPSF